jgi:hypothetical protein
MTFDPDLESGWRQQLFPARTEHKTFAERLNPLVDMVNHPPHYRHPSGIECIRITRHMSFTIGNAVKYIWRTEHKNGRQDIDKARWYLDDAIRHADPIWIRRIHDDALAALDVVVRHETDHHRIRFFTAITAGSVMRAHEAVTAML